MRSVPLNSLVWFWGQLAPPNLHAALQSGKELIAGPCVGGLQWEVVCSTRS